MYVQYFCNIVTTIATLFRWQERAKRGFLMVRLGFRLENPTNKGSFLSLFLTVGYSASTPHHHHRHPIAACMQSPSG